MSAAGQRRVVTIDCQYLRPRFAASYLLIDRGRAAFIDNNTAHSVPLLLAALKREGLTPDHVDFVIVTHVHLDHAGGTSQLMTACPQATLLAHPRAVRHLIDPTKLVTSARQVYGAEAFDRLYGRIEAIPAERVRAVADEERVAFGAGTPLRFLHTRGHANHHFCIWEPDTASIFTGDAFGVAYPALQRAGLFIFPSTSPTDFDYAQAVASVDRILDTGARTAYPTHFGAVTDLPGAARQLRAHLEFSQRLLERARAQAPAHPDPGALAAELERELWDHFAKTAGAQGLALTADDRELLKLDVQLNAQGLAHRALEAPKPPAA